MKERRVSVPLSAPASRMVERLLRDGLYGRTRGEVVQRLVYAQLENIFAKPRTWLKDRR